VRRRDLRRPLQLVQQMKDSAHAHALLDVPIPEDRGTSHRHHCDSQARRAAKNNAASGAWDATIGS
jgi:hypothetical protein